MEAVFAPFAAIAAALVTAEGRVEIKPAIYPDCASAHPPGDGDGRVAVCPAHITAEAEDAVIGDGDGMIDIVIADDDQHWPENLLARDDHIIGRAEDGGFAIIALVETVRAALATRDQGCAFTYTFADIILNDVPLRFGNHWPHRDIAVRIADGYSLTRGFGCRECLVHPGVGHEQARSRRASLPSIDHHATRCSRHIGRHVSVIKDYPSALAAQFKGNAFDGIGRILANLDAHGFGSGEADHVDIAVFGERGTDDAALTLNHVEHTRWRPRFVHDLGQDLRGIGGQLRRFKN